ncbi:MAG: hypothetical protein CL946_06285 [Ectothiorhodospiraceae bacterium]|nr:hypothetical protein [Ectothiorhodospiraceae bacterium]
MPNTTMPNLTGSDRQIAWALDIRSRWMTELDRLDAEMVRRKFTADWLSAFADWRKDLESKASAHKWIEMDQKHHNPHYDLLVEWVRTHNPEILDDFVVVQVAQRRMQEKFDKLKDGYEQRIKALSDESHEQQRRIDALSSQLRECWSHLDLRRRQAKKAGNEPTKLNELCDKIERVLS